MIQLKAARNRKQSPPLKSVQLGVQMRFTTGQMPLKCNKSPAATPMAPAASLTQVGCTQ